MISLIRLLDEPNLRRVAGVRSYDRGLDYADARRVAGWPATMSCRRPPSMVRAAIGASLVTIVMSAIILM